MHELNICFDIIKILESNTVTQPLALIKKVWLEIGLLAGIDIDALLFSFPIASIDTAAKDAKLEIIIIEGQAFCARCQYNIIIKNYFDSCPSCQQYDYKINQGKELRILKMEVV